MPAGRHYRRADGLAYPVSMIPALSRIIGPTPLQNFISPLIAEEEVIEKLLAAHSRGDSKKVMLLVAELAKAREATAKAEALLQGSEG